VLGVSDLFLGSQTSLCDDCFTHVNILLTLLAVTCFHHGCCTLRLTPSCSWKPFHSMDIQTVFPENVMLTENRV